jgi:hypothetical protein
MNILIIFLLFFVTNIQCAPKKDKQKQVVMEEGQSSQNPMGYQQGYVPQQYYQPYYSQQYNYFQPYYSQQMPVQQDYRQVHQYPQAPSSQFQSSPIQDQIGTNLMMLNFSNDQQQSIQEYNSKYQFEKNKGLFIHKIK